VEAWGVCCGDGVYSGKGGDVARLLGLSRRSAARVSCVAVVPGAWMEPWRSDELH